MPSTDIRVWGASDDLVEVSGAVREEFYAYLEPALLNVAARTEDGEVEVRLRVAYDGDWNVTEETDTGLVTIVPARGEDAGDDEDGCPGYSAKAIVRGGYAVEYVEVPE